MPESVWLNMFSLSGAAAKRAAQHQECPLCFQGLTTKPVVQLCKQDGSRSCLHQIHNDCVHDLRRPYACPLCSVAFNHFEDVPSLATNPRAWFDLMDSDRDGSITYEEVIEGLKSQFRLDWVRIEADVDRLWGQWDKNGNGTIDYSEFADPTTGVVRYLQVHYPNNPRPPPPDIKVNKRAWFEYYDEDRTGTLSKDEVARALIQTFRLYNIDRSAVINTLDMIWPIFDEDGSNQIDMREFVSTDNLADTIIAQLYVA